MHRPQRSTYLRIKTNKLANAGIDSSVQLFKIAPDFLDSGRNTVFQRQRDADCIGIVHLLTSDVALSAKAARMVSTTASPIASAIGSPSAAATGARNGRGGALRVPTS